MHRITLILLLALLLPDLYIYLVYIVRRTKNFVRRAAYWLPSATLVLLYLYLIYLTGDNALAHHPQAIGRLAIAVMALAVPKILFMLCSLLGILCRGIGRCLSAVVLHTSFVNVIYGATAGITRFEVKEVTYESDRLPEGFDGYRIAQLSDIHIGSWQGHPTAIEKLVELTNSQQADLIVFTGDLVNQQSHELDAFRPILSRLKAPDGVYSVLGNHDYGTYYHWKNSREEADNLQYLRNEQKAMGWQLLDNNHVILHHKEDSIALIGVENDGEPPFPQHADLAQATHGTKGMFSILLSHNPTHWRREVLPESDIDLMLAGHTHAMQMTLLGRSLSSLKYPEWSGMYYEGARALYVNVGIGYVGLPFRFGAWPEITVITLKKKKG